MTSDRFVHPTHHKLSALVFGFFTAFFLLCSSGRISSGDAGTQLQASVLLATTGHLGTATPPRDSDGQINNLWVRSPQGSYYQCHDIGNIVLMLPAAWLGSRLSYAPASALFNAPPLLSRLGVAWTYAVFSAAGCFFMFRLFLLFYVPRTAFLLSFAFATTTIFWAYSKSAWDVLGACVGVAFLLWVSARLLLHSQPTWRDGAWVGAGFTIACLFRYSLLPFLLLALLILAARQSRLRTAVPGFLLAAVPGLIPTFIYNFVRMGSPLRPATTAPQFDSLNALTGSMMTGVLGLLASPNRGLLEFDPVMLLLLGLPLVWKKLPEAARQILAAFGMGVAFYIALIGKLLNWGTFGWGPRYLLPVLPLLFFATGLVLTHVLQRYKTPLLALLALSFALNCAPVLINWHLASATSFAVTDAFARMPRQQIAVWHGLQLAVEGKPLPAPAEVLRDPVRSLGTKPPDLWTFYLMRQSQKGAVAGIVVTAALLLAVFVCGRRLLTLRPPEAAQK